MRSTKVTISKECMICNKETDKFSKATMISNKEQAKKIMAIERFAKQKESRTMEIINLEANLEVNLETKAITIE